MKQDESSQLRGDLRAGRVDDFTFDQLFPAPVRAKSARFWTPVAIAHRAAQLFAGQGVRRVLDVGSGAGKFCLVAACACPDIDFTGIEQRPHLVEAARLAGARLGAENARFLVGDVTLAPWDAFGGLYLYNPFAENIYRGEDLLDDLVELSVRRFMADVRKVLALLHAARVGTCMVTYNGFGGPIPTSYELAHAERAGIDWLRVWVKRREPAEGEGFYLEREDGVIVVGVGADASHSSSTSPPRRGSRRSVR